MSIFKRDGKVVAWTTALAIIIVALVVLYVVLKLKEVGAHDPVESYLVATLLPQIINTSIVVLLIGGFGAPAISVFLQNRKQRIEQEMLDANAAKQQAEQQLATVQDKMDNFEQTEQEMQKSYQKMSAQEREQILADAKKQASIFERDARVAQHTQARQKQRAFELELMQNVLNSAHSEIQAKLAGDSSLRSALIDQSIAKLDVRA